jgi:hypothetical protein
MFLVGIYGPNVVDLDPMVKISLENTPNAMLRVVRIQIARICVLEDRAACPGNRDEGS